MKHASSLWLPVLAALAFSATNPARAADGEAIVKKARCVACHAVDQKRVGPAYKDVAAKYKGDAAAEGKLAAALKEGKGHPKVNATDAELKTLLTSVLATK